MYQSNSVPLPAADRSEHWIQLYTGPLQRSTMIEIAVCAASVVFRLRCKSTFAGHWKHHTSVSAHSPPLRWHGMTHLEWIWLRIPLAYCLRRTSYFACISSATKPYKVEWKYAPFFLCQGEDTDVESRPTEAAIRHCTHCTCLDSSAFGRRWKLSIQKKNFNRNWMLLCDSSLRFACMRFAFTSARFNYHPASMMTNRFGRILKSGRKI